MGECQFAYCERLEELGSGTSGGISSGYDTIPWDISFWLGGRWWCAEDRAHFERGEGREKKSSG